MLDDKVRETLRAGISCLPLLFGTLGGIHREEALSCQGVAAAVKKQWYGLSTRLSGWYSSMTLIDWMA